MATYRNETFSNLPPLTPRSRVQFGSTDRHIYNPTDSLTDNSFLSRPLSPTQNRRQIIEVTLYLLMCAYVLVHSLDL